MSTLEIFFTIVGMAIVTLICRAFFLFPERDLPMPQWLKNGMQYAPVAALAAVVSPEIVMSNGQLIDNWLDARVIGGLAGIAYYMWRKELFGTIVAGTVVMLVMRSVLS